MQAINLAGGPGILGSRLKAGNGDARFAVCPVGSRIAR
jgi:hypothetical protein